MSRMYERLANDELAIGAIIPVHGAEFVEILGYVGFDWICVDLMVSSLDWSEVATLILAAKRYDVTPWVRLSTYPWESEEIDTGLAPQALRALSMGAECVIASVNTATQVERLIAPLENAHRRFYIQQGEHQGGGRTDAQRKLDAAEPEQRIFPCIESLAAANRIDEILAVPGLKMIYLGMGDLSRELGHPSDDRHPEVREVIGGIVAKANERGIVVAANTLAYKRGTELSELITDGVESLADLGVRAIMIPRATMIVQRFYERTFENIRTRVPKLYS